jgi:hypothetical protein
MFSTLSCCTPSDIIPVYLGWPSSCKSFGPGSRNDIRVGLGWSISFCLQAKHPYAYVMVTAGAEA